MAKRALITGIRRIGERITEHLIREGWDLAVVYNSSEDRADRLGKVAEAEGRKFLKIKADLSDPSSYGAVISQVKDGLGGLEAFIHLASPYERRDLRDVTLSEFEFYLRSIAVSFFFLTKECADLMRENDGPIKGRVIAFGDWAVEHTPYRGYAHYFVAKGALHTAVRVLAKELAPDILVNCVAPGPVIKPEDLSEDAWKGILSRTPLRREVPIEDVLGAVRFLLESTSVTGEIIRVDSGRHIAGSGLGSLEG